MSREQLTRDADRIVHGKVVRTWTAWDPGHEFIWTHYQLTVIDRLKGPQSPTVVVSEPGGTLDGRSLAIQGTPRMRIGDVRILFLYRTPIGYWRSVGFGQGCYPVASGRVQYDLLGAQMAPNSGADSGTPLETLNGISVAEFKTRIRAVLLQQSRPEANS